MLKKKSGYVVAIVGATGAVGKETLEMLEERKFPIASFGLFASNRSAGEVMTFEGKEWKVEVLTKDLVCRRGHRAYFCDRRHQSRVSVRLGTAGVVVIDDSGVFRMES